MVANLSRGVCVGVGWGVCTGLCGGGIGVKCIEVYSCAKKC